MATIALPPVTSLQEADDNKIEFTLDLLFEPSQDLHLIAVPAIRNSTPFSSYPSLIEYVGDLLFQLADNPTTADSRAELHAILSSHPRLGEEKVDSAQSRAEQAHLNANSASDVKEGEAARLKALNEEYEARFPGLRYIVFVNGRSRDIIMQNMRERINRGDIFAEQREAIQAMIDIALDRAKRLQAAN
ncbi:Oxo-4-hydroxy-4-carboxy-5-ureidoimidazoline decarboxylase [Daldinia sp. FL1419]|nr:Oxo-4-hydroxy-4-carboxy-5-ureidoimidazoline decarboxylase [Daldinia sp. FL1419]